MLTPGTVDGSECADVNGTDDASFQAGIASRLSVYNPLARKPPFRWLGLKAVSHCFLSSLIAIR